MTYIQERGSTHVYHVNRMSKEEMDHMIGLCVHEHRGRSYDPSLPLTFDLRDKHEWNLFPVYMS